MYDYQIKRDIYASGRETFYVLRKLKNHEAGTWETIKGMCVHRSFNSRAESLKFIKEDKIRSLDRKLDFTTYEDIP